MTHDPREALERLEHACEMLAGIRSQEGQKNALSALDGVRKAAREALTASAPKGDPCDILPAETVAWSFIDYHQIPVGLHAALADLVRRARNDTSPPPAAGWNGGRDHD